eukprot:Hpha_TRINITY_DN3774_c0_g1::TRINITY_DN3774_c0_g1_i2::g.23846::m.23846
MGLARLLSEPEDDVGRALWISMYAWLLGQLAVAHSLSVETRLRVAWWSTLPLAYTVSPSWLLDRLHKVVWLRHSIGGVFYFLTGMAAHSVVFNTTLPRRTRFEYFWAAASALCLFGTEREQLCSLVGDVPAAPLAGALLAVPLVQSSAPLALASFAMRDVAAGAEALLSAAGATRLAGVVARGGERVRSAMPCGEAGVTRGDAVVSVLVPATAATASALFTVWRAHRYGRRPSFSATDSLTLPIPVPRPRRAGRSPVSVTGSRGRPLACPADGSDSSPRRQRSSPWALQDPPHAQSGSPPDHSHEAPSLFHPTSLRSPVLPTGPRRPEAPF